ncbi:MAG: hypothetical protein OEV43_01790 [Coriobacteriia bacterium]|nr:hypothetical protein [Coriobacteriia bacterium]
MEITTTPACRVGWQGQTLRYVVTAEGASEIVVPDENSDVVRIRIAQTRHTGDGIEADLDVEVLNSTPY